jgi:hypothetical protein
MPRLYNEQNGAFIGTLSDADLEVLVDQLEEEDQTDADYFIDGATIDLLEENGASESLVTMLRAAVGSSEGIDVRWTE